MFNEGVGVRQGGMAAPDEYKIYNNPNLLTLESLAGEDVMAGHPTSIICVADDETASTQDAEPRIAISNMQVLLYAIESHGTQHHIGYGVAKCGLLVTARPSKMKNTLKILEEEPGILTFFDKPVSVGKV